MSSAQSVGPVQPPRVLGDEEGDLRPPEAPQGTMDGLGLKQERSQLCFQSGIDEDRGLGDVTQNRWCVQLQLEERQEGSRQLQGPRWGGEGRARLTAMAPGHEA